ncbi:MAG: DNA mismatch repair endonuclease MutL [Flavobacteriales bacterium]
MPDIIHLLPESVANQIAAGEVVQRPASVVKELMENSIDAGAGSVKLILKDAGKILIQVTDNGKGMSETDARMAFERHATSKIKKIEDLFTVTTKGFRGEALASIAAIAQVELKTRQTGAQLGTRIEMEGSKIKAHEADQCPEGTTFWIKNLFYNVPARRYFLKNDAIELRHCIDEFQRIAFTHPDVEFLFTHNGAEVFTLPKAPLRQRIVHMLGNRYNEKLVPVDERTDIVNVSGFIGKPESAKKTRGEQFFFVNNRYIRNAYLHHAIMSAFESLLPSGSFPLYLLYLEIDPEQIDINIHPTKTEIKFRDERAIYAILLAAVKRALGKFNISPSLDFEQETAIQISPLRAGQDVQYPKVDVNPDYNPFGASVKKNDALSGWFDRREREQGDWKDMLQVALEVKTTSPAQSSVEAQMDHEVQTEIQWEDDAPPFQLHRKYITRASRTGLLLVDQQRAHQRILFEKYMRQLEIGSGYSQQLLFPETIDMAAGDFALLHAEFDALHALGFEIEEFGGTTFKLNGIPADAGTSDGQRLLEDFVEQIKNERQSIQYSPREKLAWALARTASIRYGQMLTQPEMKELLQLLFKCDMPYISENNKATVVTLSLQQLEQQFR